MAQWVQGYENNLNDIISDFESAMESAASCTDPAEPKEGSPVGALDDGTGNSAVPRSLTRAWGELCAVANVIPDGLSVHEFVGADEHVVVCEKATDEAIVSSVCEAAVPDEQRPEQPEKTTSPQDVLNAFDTIRTFFDEHNDDVAMNYFLQCSSSAPVEPHAPGEQPTPVVSSVPPQEGGTVPLTVPVEANGEPLVPPLCLRRSQRARGTPHHLRDYVLALADC
ncbi:hypothetical protein HPB51_021873 [Rhipicephalus microplus]|uniref:Uncharacterized protein n=1 Tax=Rhipicephalus microplus TaxID=6941 RepID=A0A9J6EIG3_RHIMP|nr:hypothetical protein HPB51_021873 [Rhipicephalus microplus]